MVKNLKLRVYPLVASPSRFTPVKPAPVAPCIANSAAVGPTPPVLVRKRNASVDPPGPPRTFTPVYPAPVVPKPPVDPVGPMGTLNMVTVTISFSAKAAPKKLGSSVRISRLLDVSLGTPAMVVKLNWYTLST